MYKMYTIKQYSINFLLHNYVSKLTQCRCHIRNKTLMMVRKTPKRLAMEAMGVPPDSSLGASQCPGVSTAQFDQRE